VPVATVSPSAPSVWEPSSPLRRKFSDNVLLAASAVAYGLAPLAVVWLPFGAAIPVLVLAGVAWLMTLTTLNAAAQLSLPRWVMARGLAVYLLVATGSQALGSYFWGAVATRAGLHVSMLGSAAMLGLVALSVLVLPLRPSTGKMNVEVSPAWPMPALVFEPCPNDGPVLVAVRYLVPADNVDSFIEAMSEVRRSRLRTGGHSWRLYHSVGKADEFLERFTVTSWTEFERQRTERWLELDSEGVQRAIGYTVDRTRTHEYYVAHRVRR
jgi:hypothetical protein